jgi:small subunit ribosomal protein S21
MRQSRRKNVSPADLAVAAAGEDSPGTGVLAAAVAVAAAEGGDRPLQVNVHGNDVEGAIRNLKRKLQQEGLFRELKKRKHYSKPSVKKKLKQQEAQRRRRKALRFKKPERD